MEKKELKKEFYHRYEGQISSIMANEIWSWIEDLLTTPSVRGEYSEEEMQLLEDAVAFHQSCESCRKAVKDFQQKNFDLLQKIGNRVKLSPQTTEGESK